MVAQPWRRAEELVTLWLCVAPLQLGGLRGKKSTPSVWLGGTGGFFAVGKQEQELQERGVIFEAGDKAKVRPSNLSSRMVNV